MEADQPGKLAAWDLVGLFILVAVLGGLRRIHFSLGCLTVELCFDRSVSLSGIPGDPVNHASQPTSDNESTGPGTCITCCR